MLAGIGDPDTDVTLLPWPLNSAKCRRTDHIRMMAQHLGLPCYNGDIVLRY